MEVSPTTQAYSTAAPPMIEEPVAATEAPVTTEAYTTAAPPTIEEPVAATEAPVTTEAYTTAAPPMIEEPVATEAPVTTEAYTTAAPPTIEEPVATEAPVTTEAYTTAAPPTIEEPVATEDELEEKPLYKDRPVRDILDKITVYFQQKSDVTRDYLTNTYCKSDKKLQYYKVHPTDGTKYVECSPWGKGEVKSCPEGRLWDQFYEICSTPTFIESNKNLTLELEKSEKLASESLGLNCHNSQYKCVNAGECVAFEEGHRCQCARKFTGEFCQHRVVRGSIFSEILTDKFNFTEFRDEVDRTATNASQLTPEEMTNIRRLLKTTTHDEIMGYLDQFDKKNVRYDIVMNELIERILEDIYPDAYYVSAFNASSHRLVDVVRTIPSLISYSKYTNERYAEVFTKYQEVLDKTVLSLNSTWSYVGAEAGEYIKITNHILNETGLLGEVLSGVQKAQNVTQKETVAKLEKAYKVSVEKTLERSLELTGLRRSLIKEMVNKPSIINMRLSELVGEYKWVRELVGIFDEVNRDSNEVINSLFSYGFWYVTNALALRV